MKYLLTVLLTSFFFSLQAQLSKTLHQTFPLGNYTQIALDLISDSTEIVPWAGNTILTETHVELYGASPSILRHFVEKDTRYVIESDSTDQCLTLFSAKKERKPIWTRTGECPEIVRIKIFVPEKFIRKDETTLVKS